MLSTSSLSPKCGVTMKEFASKKDLRECYPKSQKTSVSLILWSIVFFFFFSFLLNGRPRFHAVARYLQVDGTNIILCLQSYALLQVKLLSRKSYLSLYYNFLVGTFCVRHWPSISNESWSLQSVPHTSQWILYPKVQLLVWKPCLTLIPTLLTKVQYSQLLTALRISYKINLFWLLVKTCFALWR